MVCCVWIMRWIVTGAFMVPWERWCGRSTGRWWGIIIIALDGDASRTQMDPEYALGLRYAYRHVLLSLSYDRVMGSESGTQDNMAGPTY